MLKGERIGLRARLETDIPVLHAELYDDVTVRVRADSRPWRPLDPASASSPYRGSDVAEDFVQFSVVQLDDGSLVGEAVVWGIDRHNRSAHIGLSILPRFRGRSYGTDTVDLLCYYAFSILGLHRLQVDTLADNGAMIRAAIKCGFVNEGTRRGAAWAEGHFADEVLLGLLSPDWAPRR